MDVSIIVPCYNSPPVLHTLIERSEQEMENLGIKEYEFVLVNDGSPDPNTIVMLRCIAAANKRVKVIDMAKNSGQPNSQVAALRYSTGDIIINMDDDMQTDPANIPLLYNKLMEGYDLVLGKYIKKRHNLFRRLLTWADNIFEHYFIGKPKHLSFTSFWITRRYIADEIVKYHNPYSFMEGLFLRTAGKIANVEMEHHERSEGKSGYTLGKLLKLWSNFTGFTILPLRIAGFMGVIAAICSILGGIWTIVQRLTTPDMPAGYATLVCLMLFFFGLVFIFIGILGEYVGRTFMSVNATPQYVVKEFINFEESDEKHG